LCDLQLVVSGAYATCLPGDCVSQTDDRVENTYVAQEFEVAFPTATT